MKKKKVIQLSLFDHVEKSFEDEVWEKFKLIVDKLKTKGFRSLDEMWWHSRYFDSFLHPNFVRICPFGYEFEHKANKAWFYIWETNKNYILK